MFDVRNNGGVVRLSVSEGVVEAAHPWILNERPTNLTTRQALRAGEQITASMPDGLSEVQAFREESFASWREDRLKYVGAPLSELIADANRYSARPIVIDADAPEIDDLRVTFSFNGRDIDDMLSALPTIFPVEVDQSSEERIVVRGHAAK